MSRPHYTPSSCSSPEAEFYRQWVPGCWSAGPGIGKDNSKVASISRAAVCFPWMMQIEELDPVGKEMRPSLQNHPTDSLSNSLSFARAMIRQDSADKKQGREWQNQKKSYKSQKLSFLFSRIHSRPDIPLGTSPSSRAVDLTFSCVPLLPFSVRAPVAPSLPSER